MCSDPTFPGFRVVAGQGSPIFSVPGNHLAFDLSDPVAEAKGEIYRYVGDEIIVSWMIARGNAGAGAIGCLPAIEDVLVDRCAEYVAGFGAIPRLRGALHAGPVVVGEMGAAKREIVISGDTMNTAARIKEVCRQTDHDYIASAAALRAAGPLPAGLRAEALGPMPLRGKEEQIELFALSRTGAARSDRDVAAERPGQCRAMASIGSEISMSGLYWGITLPDDRDP